MLKYVYTNQYFKELLERYREIGLSERVFLEHLESIKKLEAAIKRLQNCGAAK